MSFPIVSAMTAGLLLSLLLGLKMNVGFYRTKVQVGAGTGDDITLERRIRRHANLAEDAALFVVALALAELSGGPAALIIGCATVFVLARLCHALAFASSAGSHMTEGSKLFLRLRVVGAMGTILSGFVLAGYLVYAAIAASGL